ncbi:MAG: nucleotidyltransferase domain-containing protein [Actinomycetota bacterium]
MEEKRNATRGMARKVGATISEVVNTAVTAEEALSRLEPEERDWVRRFRDEARSVLGERLRDLRLFGSRARGEKHEESDIDLLVLVAALDDDTRTLLVDLAFSISTWLSPLIADFDLYHAPRSRATGLYREMRAESIRL